MNRGYLLCHKCRKAYEIGPESFCRCCGGILTVEYEEPYLKKAAALLKNRRKNSMWDFMEVLPPAAVEHIVTLGEGMTRLKKSRRLGEELGISGLFYKDETENPTGSFKDRPVSVCVSMAKEFNCSGIAASSSGNGGAAAAAYGTAGEIGTAIFVPETTPAGKVAQALAYGGNVFKVKGDFSNSYRAAMEMAEKKNFMNVTTTFLNPYGVEGDKIIAFELWEQLSKVPDYIFIPVGAGPILYGIYKGFRELESMGLIDRLPALVCVQSAGCAPIASAFLEKRKVTCWNRPETIASAISDPLDGYEQDGDLTIEAVEATEGTAVIVSDEEIREAGLLLARKDDIFVELSTASVIAGIKKLIKSGSIQKDSVCVCLLTGHGLKDSGGYMDESTKIPLISSIEEL